jgi:hypothetical protein
MATAKAADCSAVSPRETVIKYVPSGNVPAIDATISVDVAERTVSGSRSSVTTGGSECPFRFDGRDKFSPAMTRRLFDSSNLALVITSCGVSVSADAATAHKISIPSPRTVVDMRFGSIICKPPGFAAEICKRATRALAIRLTHSSVSLLSTVRREEGGGSNRKFVCRNSTIPY